MFFMPINGTFCTKIAPKQGKYSGLERGEFSFPAVIVKIGRSMIPA
jgi:hypothetical protein